LFTQLLDFLKPYRKSVAGFVTPGVLILLGALLPASDGGFTITGAEWSTAITACLATAGVVWKVKNHPKPSNRIAHK
jgi:hypothetical protein